MPALHLPSPDGPGAGRMNILTNSATRKVLIPVFCLLVLTEILPAQSNIDPEKVIGAAECGRCHSVELLAWQKSQHYRTFRELPSSTTAEEIANRMDIFDMTEEADCLQCHFTQKKEESDPHPKAISGVSCELCHGAAKDWVNLHNDLGEYRNRKAEEPPEHRQARLKKAYAAGMNPLTNLVDFVTSCYECHTVPNEKLVNAGGHKAGSPFEFISWSQGEVRHNFLKSEVKNGQRPRKHLQFLYVIGRIIDLEYGLRGLAKATEDGPYAKAMVLRTQLARNHLVDVIIPNERIRKPRVELEELKYLVDLIPREFMFNNAAEYEKLADQIHKTAYRLAARLRKDAGNLNAVDRLIPLSNKYQGAIFRE